MYTPESQDIPICFPVTKVIRYRAKRFHQFKGEHAMMKELQRGPIACSIASNPDLADNYRGGIYQDMTNFTHIDHVVEVVGWGEKDGTKYWHIRNSWGTYV